jgi:signal transduction histidine kinase
MQLAEPDVLLDLFWVTILIGAFAFRLPAALLRIGLASIFVVGYTFVEAGGLGPPSHFEVLDLAELPLLIVISILVAVLADRLSTTARRYAGLYRRASDRLLTAQEVERGRLSRDLHDSVGQTLTAVLLSLDAAEADSPAVRSLSQRAGSCPARGSGEPPWSRPGRGHSSVASSQRVGLEPYRAGMAGVPVETRFDPLDLPPGLLDADREIGIYRVVQEAMGNAARHSQAKHIWIAASVRPQTVTIEVGDDGLGFDPGSRPEKGLGLAGMRERADSLSGRLSVRTHRGSGTTVTFVVRRPSVTAPRPASAAAADMTIATEVAH